ncbi:MAG: sigma-70 family RNA polymerase sigma factor [Calditrichia bacterium]
MMKNDDHFLVRQCLEGNQTAFEGLVDKYQKIIYNMVYRFCKDFDEAEDITQTVFIKAYEKLKTFNAKYKFFSWLYRIAVNESLNFLKKKKDGKNIDTIIQCSEQNPEQTYLQVELSENIQRSLMQLQPNYRIIIILRHFAHCSYNEISEILDIPVRKVKSRLYSARQILREILIQRGVITHD